MTQGSLRLWRAAILFVSCAWMCSLVPAGALFAQSSAVAALLQHAQQLDAGGKPDLAAQAWRQVLLADPGNQTALAKLARANTAAIRGRSAPPPAVQDARLDRAQHAAIEGDNAEAFHLYQQVFGDDPPKDWAIAYYRAESSLPDERTKAAAGLRQWMKRFPNDSEFAIEYGRVLTLDPATRVDGVRILEEYASAHPGADRALRQALLWDVNDPRMTAEIEAYLTRHQDQPDKALTQAIARSNSVRQRGAQIAAAYRALKQNNAALAGKQFRNILESHPGDANAMAGIGFVSMQRQNFPNALHWLELARSHGVRDASVRQAIETARFWLDMQTASAALENHSTSDARDAVEAALRIEPHNVEAMLLLARIFVETGRPAEGASLYRQVVAQNAASTSIDAQAWCGWLQSSAALRQFTDVLAALDRLSANQRDQLQGNFEYLLSLAEFYSAAGRWPEAADAFARAIALPANAATEAQRAGATLQYAALCVNAHQYPRAEGAYRGLASVNPHSAAAWRGLVLVEHLQGEDDQAWKTVKQMPEATQAESMRDFRFLMLLAGIQQSRGKTRAARDLLIQAQALVQNNNKRPSGRLVGQLADLDLELGDARAAIPLYRAELTRSPQDAAAWIGLLSALHQAGDDIEASSQQRRISEPVRLQIDGNATLSSTYFRTMAGVARSSGDPKAALGWLQRLDALEQSHDTEQVPGIELQEAWLEYDLHQDQAAERSVQRLRRMIQSGVSGSADQREQIAELTAELAVRRATELTAQGNRREATRILNIAAQQVGSDSKARMRLAAGYLTAGEPASSIAIYESVDMRTATVGDLKAAISAAMETRQKNLAEDWLQRTMARDPHDPGLLLLAAQFAQANGNLPLAEKYLRAAIATTQLSNTGNKMSSADSSQSTKIEQQANDLLVSIMSSYSGWLDTAAYLNHFTGTPGTTQLTDIEIPVEASASIGERARVTAIARTVHLNSGPYKSVANQPLGTLTGSAEAAAVPMTGVGGEIQLATRNFAAGLGASPVGFPVMNVTAAATLHMPSNPWTISVSRDSIRESQLAYAGLHDPGQPADVWGGVVRNLATVQYARGNALSGWYATANSGAISGHHVQTNPEVSGDVGGYRQVWARPTASLKVGVNFYGQHDARNELFYTYGHGGYFSPEFYLQPGVPLTLTGQRGSRFDYQFAGSLGPQIFREDSSPFFPLDAGLQKFRGNPVYSAQSTFDLNYGAKGKASYRFGEHWRLDAFFSVNNAAKYNQQVGGVSLHYLFRSQHRSPSHPAGWFSHSGLRPYLVP